MTTTDGHRLRISSQGVIHKRPSNLSHLSATFAHLEHLDIEEPEGQEPFKFAFYGDTMND